jgi:hypothetical protein
MFRNAHPRIAIALLLLLAAGHACGGQTYSYRDRNRTYEFSVVPTGSNHTFEFSSNPGAVEERLKAVRHVFDAVYGDGSIAPHHNYFFMKEGAKCFVFDASLHEYQACFLPNEYSPENKQRFWGYVTRINNGWWLFTRNILPAAALLAAIVYFLMRR